jgi:hypothetical protein
MNTTLVLSFSIALSIVVLALIREMRLRRGLQALLTQILKSRRLPPDDD